MAFDKDDNVYLAYTSVVSGDWMEMEIDTTPRFESNEPDTLTTVNGLFGHIYMTHKLNGGTRWSAPVNITPNEINSLFSSIAGDVRNERIYMAYNASPMPGDHVYHVELPDFAADVMFVAVPTSELNPLTSVDEQQKVEAEISVFPNPADDIVNIQIAAQQTGTLRLTVLNATGEEIASSVSPDGAGNWNAGIPTAGLASGVYVVLIEQNGRSTSRVVSVLH